MRGCGDTLRRVIRLALVAAALVLMTASASAETVFDLGAKAPVTNGKIWRDLLSAIFPDLRQETVKDGKIGDFIHGKVELRPIDKEAFSDDCADDAPRIEYINFARVEIAGQMRVIVGVTTEHDACFGALALFEGTGDRLIDAVNIQQDANYGFGPNFVRLLGREGQLVVADSFHTTTSNAPDNYVLVLATADKLSLIGNVDAQSQRDCHREIAENPYVVITPDYSPFDRITGYIKRSVQRLAPDCETHQGNPVVTITRTDWRWNAAKRAYTKVSR